MFFMPFIMGSMLTLFLIKNKDKSMKMDGFSFSEGDRLTGKYEILDKLGAGWEGEVYRIKEISTGIERAAKIFFPQRNRKGKSSRFYATKLHKLRQCQILIKYHNEETVYIEGIPITVLVSEYVEGELLSDFIKTFKGKRMRPYVALHLLYALVKGIEEIHLLSEYHGDLHMDNVIVNRFGLNFELKLLDMFHWGASTKANRQYDIVLIAKIFYDCLGGAAHYSQQPKEVKSICCGLKESLILRKFPHISQLREHLEKLNLDSRT